MSSTQPSASAATEAENWEDIAAAPFEQLRLASRSPSQQGAKAFSADRQGADAAWDGSQGVRGSQQAGPSSFLPKPDIDEALEGALAKMKDRLSVLRYEELCRIFLGQQVEEVLRFPLELTTYQRLLVHRVAHYHGLITASGDEIGEDKGRIIARKGPASSLPDVKLADIPVHQQPASRAAEGLPGRVNVLKKDPAATVKAAQVAAAAAQVASQREGMTREEREAAYQEARARIFGRRLQPRRPPQAPPAPPWTGQAPRRLRQLLFSKMQVGTQLGLLWGSAPAGEAPEERSSSRGGRNNSERRGKAVLRNREQDLMDPDYRRGGHAAAARVDSIFGEPRQTHPGTFMRPTYTSEASTAVIAPG
eukprot:jgi/Astpho2/2784/Aster-x0552